MRLPGACFVRRTQRDDCTTLAHLLIGEGEVVDDWTLGSEQLRVVAHHADRIHRKVEVHLHPSHSWRRCGQQWQLGL